MPCKNILIQNNRSNQIIIKVFFFWSTIIHLHLLFFFPLIYNEISVLFTNLIGVPFLHFLQDNIKIIFGYDIDLKYLSKFHVCVEIDWITGILYSSVDLHTGERVVEYAVRKWSPGGGGLLETRTESVPHFSFCFPAAVM